MQMYSYDVFDTVLYRAVPQPTDIFIKMACAAEFKKILKVQPKKFAQVRRNCETILRHTRKKEVSIEAIYKEIEKIFKINQSEAYTLQNLELCAEIECTFLNKKIVTEITERLSRKEHVVLISDMYWSGEVIRKLLVAKDDVFKNIEIYSSCDWDASKAKGALFAIVKEKENVLYEQWWHIGDNLHSDYRVPQALGIKCTLLPKCFSFDYEKKLNMEDSSIRDIYSIVCKARQQAESKAYCLGASFAAPMVYQYVEWVLTQAMVNDIQVLYFVLRDGYILQKVAQEIIKSRGLPLKAELLFGSRVAWRFPEVTPEKLKNLSLWEKSNWIFRDPAYAYVPFERLGFSKAEIIGLFGSEFAEKQLLSFREFKAALDEALQNEQFCKLLKKKAQAAGENLDQYLQQNLDETAKFALVDTNSTGKTQRDLNAFRAKRNSNSRPIEFFYHTYLSDEKPNQALQHAFLCAEQADRRFPEALFRAPYNPCYGYEKNADGLMQPIFFEGATTAWYGKFSYDEYLDGIIQFTKEAEAKRKSLYFNFDGYVDFLMRVANFDIVSKDELHLVAQLPFNPDLCGNEVLDFYPKLKMSALLHPFSELIYYSKGSFYQGGLFWKTLYGVLLSLVKMRRGLST